MTREEAIEIFKRLKENAPNEMHLETVGSAQELFDMAIQALSQEATDIISRGAFEQVMRAFDIAVGQLKELGYGLGQKIEPCTDAVSREAVCDYIAEFVNDEYSTDAECEMVDAMIEGIQHLPPVNPQPCDDAISREWLMRKATERFYTTNYFNHISAMIEEAPSVTQKSGKWILLDKCANSGYYCSECHKKLVKEGWSNTVKKINYCPNCGAKMESEE